jgi:hypothetical protein
MAEGKILNRRVGGGFAEDAEKFWWSARGERCRDPYVGSPRLRRELRCLKMTTRDGRGRPSCIWGNVRWFGLRAQMELSFGYLSRFRDGCYTRQLWQSLLTKRRRWARIRFMP